MDIPVSLFGSISLDLFHMFSFIYKAGYFIPSKRNHSHRQGDVGKMSVLGAFQARIQQHHWRFAEMEGRSAGQINSGLAATTLRQSLIGMPPVIRKSFPHPHPISFCWLDHGGSMSDLVSLRRSAPSHLDSLILTAPSLIGFNCAGWSYANLI